ncbi:hypothetical protein C8F04DRAFT_174713 [Mycena alexandri]|uniref:Uncharacterized protein n=1 Tax=Mycena alexandri TaxID=1745969 RepID=A0AAD6S9R4_9AGAR|nr:hypothetical protein C8F04DRAFT_174713 [Mycena alexandri]
MIARMRRPTALKPELFTLEEKLYLAGARIFLFIGVPPIERTPAGAHASSDISATCTNCNSGLRHSVQNLRHLHACARQPEGARFLTEECKLRRRRGLARPPASDQ